MLSNRQLQILRVIVDDFITSAQPVGSRQISKREDISFSPATIRNEMADLEELGFLEKTHTSSGRVPSQKGYRFYVDHLLKPQVITAEDIRQIQSVFSDQIMEMEQVIRKTATILSELTSYTSILLGPSSSSHKVKKFSLVPLTEGNAVAIIVTDNGHVENRLVSVPAHLAPQEMEKMVNILNDRLVGVSLADVHLKIESEVIQLMHRHVGQVDEFIRGFFNVPDDTTNGKVVYGGKLNILNQPEFHNLDKIRSLMDMMDETNNKVTSIIRPANRNIEIRIGTENNHFAMEDCSIITASFTTNEQDEGAIAIIGPTRMDYQRVVALLDFMRQELSRNYLRPN
ncbi:heat-inducible transcriptional repressor HrcA [Caryophanon tenue]|uniref:Heat-inducible transcription repressor HrcA n=1 Tax=Caryophanon tenue TaxID=33978 RepID=A0A1C0YMW9_9BACL|nr:heat-inducible transcriptional repressor HrcA [Caryophanon tenue]OCS88514.1 heat-inducible transcriptional repressor HrcA [Caryophanon tenue]